MKQWQKAYEIDVYDTAVCYRRRRVLVSAARCVALSAQLLWRRRFSVIHHQTDNIGGLAKHALKTLSTFYARLLTLPFI